MEIKETLQTQLPICKIKYGTWKDFQSIGNLPKTFSDFIRIVSSLVYPFNFSIYYMSQDYVMIPMCSSTAYKNLIKFVKTEKSLKEIKIFVILHENKNESQNDSLLITQDISKTIKSKNPEFNLSDDESKNESEFDESVSICLKEKPSYRYKRDGRKKHLRKTNRGANSVCIQCY